jgi:hypothetical protein
MVTATLTMTAKFLCVAFIEMQKSTWLGASCLHKVMCMTTTSAFCSLLHRGSLLISEATAARVAGPANPARATVIQTETALLHFVVSSAKVSSMYMVVRQQPKGTRRVMTSASTRTTIKRGNWPISVVLDARRHAHVKRARVIATQTRTAPVPCVASNALPNPLCPQDASALNKETSTITITATTSNTSALVFSGASEATAARRQ